MRNADSTRSTDNEFVRKRRHAYACAVLEREAAAVAASKRGGRNAQLNNAAFAVGQVMGDVISLKEVEATLLQAARQADLEEIEARATIKSGLTAGLGSPRTASELIALNVGPAANTQAPSSTNPLSPAADDKQARALLIWAQADPIEGTPAQAYFRGRGITSTLSDALRWHSGTTMPDGGRHPCVIAAVTVPTSGRFVALQRIALRPDGSDKASISPAKASLGRTKGAAVVLGDLYAGDAILEGEGVETVLSACQAMGWPGIAALSCESLGRASLPEGRPVVILVDRGAEAKALQGAQRRLAEGRAVSLAYVPSDLQPEAKGLDANDVLRERGLEAVCTMVQGATQIHSDPTPLSLLPPGFTRNAIGEIYVEVTDGPGEGSLAKLCSPLEILAATRDIDGRSWALVVRALNPDGQWCELFVPRSMLASDGSELRAKLLDLGVIIEPSRDARHQLIKLFNTASPRSRALSVGRVGWHERAFVLPDKSFGDAEDPRIVWQPATPATHAYRVSGTLEGWQETIGAPAIGNSRLILALSAAFAGPLLGPLGLEGGGFHFRGVSSSGKTTLLRMAGSVWGGGGLEGYVRRWRATANGLEGVATLHCDGLLCLDELAEIEGRDAHRAAYMLANGQGKQRAGLAGEARMPHAWRVLFLSTGELSLANKIAEDGYQATAGQEVRVLDIVADAGAGHGLFENLHDALNADTFAQRLRQGSLEDYGHAARHFLAQLTIDLDEAIEQVRRSISVFRDGLNLSNASGQVRRAADRFALVAAAGELAVQYGILPWAPHEAMRGVERCYRDWLHKRGSIGDREEDRAFETVRAFLEAHGTSRFAPILEPDRPVANRVGFYHRQSGGGLTYYILPEAWRFEVCKGLDPTCVAKALSKRGVLRHEHGSYSIRISVGGERRRVYAIDQAVHESLCPDGPTCPIDEISSND